MVTLEEKFRISSSSALLSLIINLPQTYALTSSILPLNLVDPATGCPTPIGQLVHTLVFFAFTFLTMGNPYENTSVKVKHSLYGSLISFFLSSPAFYSLVNSLLGSQFSSTNGCPTLLGVIFSAVMYCLALVAVMYLPERNE